MKWTKKDIKIMCQAISSFWLINRPLSDSMRVHNDALADVRAYLGEHRTHVVLQGIADLGNLAHHRYEENLKTAEHFKNHPEIYGKSNPEMIERFTNLASDHHKDFLKAKSLMEKIEANGLPPEVMSFDPTQRP